MKKTILMMAVAAAMMGNAQAQQTDASSGSVTGSDSQTNNTQSHQTQSDTDVAVRHISPGSDADKNKAGATQNTEKPLAKEPLDTYGRGEKYGGFGADTYQQKNKFGGY